MSQFCTSCGTEVDSGTSFCGDCGAQLRSTEELTADTIEADTGPCKKCTTQIPLKAQKCPQCGYEPGKGVLGPIGKIIGFLLMMGAMFQIMIGLLLLITPFGGAPISSALTGAGIFIGAGAIQGAIARWIGKFGTYYAAEQPDETPLGEYTGASIDEESKSVMEELRESYETGGERGDQWRERIDERINELPSSVFSATILAGTLFVFFTFIIAGMETELAGIPTEDLVGILLVMSLIIFPFTVMADIGRVNRVYDANHKWWAWVLPAVIPIIGFIPALAWLWRRRSTTQETDERKPPQSASGEVDLGSGESL